MLYAGEVVNLSSALIVSTTVLLGFVWILLFIRPRLNRFANRLTPSQRTVLGTAGLLAAMAYAFIGADLPSRGWMVLGAAVVLALAVSAGHRACRSLVIQLGWVLIVWHSMVLAKYVYLPELSPLAVNEGTRAMVFNYGLVLVQPILLLCRSFAVPGAEPVLDFVLTSVSGVARYTFIPLVSVFSLMFVHTMASFFPLSEDADTAHTLPAALRTGLTALALIALLTLVLWISGMTFVQPVASAILLLALLLLPVCASELASGRTAGGTGLIRTAMFQAVLGGAAWAWGPDARLRALGMVVLMCSVAVPIFRAARLLFVTRAGRVRVVVGFIVLWLSLITLPFAVLLLAVGVADALLDIKGLGAGRPSLKICTPRPHRHLLKVATLAAMPLLVWCGGLAVYKHLTAYHSMAKSLPVPSTVIADITGDPWRLTSEACKTRGLRTCSADRVACNAEGCDLEASLPVRVKIGVLICFPREGGPGRMFSTIGGWFPPTGMPSGIQPWHFRIPADAHPTVLFRHHQLAVFCCSGDDSGRRVQ